MIVTNRASGNILFLILIAVALFAALSYVISQSTRSGTPSTDKENVSLEVAYMLEFSSKLRVATQRMMLRGISADNIRLHPTGVAYTYCTNEPNCIFDPANDGMVYYELANKVVYSTYGNAWDFYETADGYVLPDIGTSAPELMLVRKIKFTEAGKRLCDALNAGLGYVYASTPLNVFPAGRSSGCIQVNSTFYFYYFALIEN